MNCTVRCSERQMWLWWLRVQDHLPVYS